LLALSSNGHALRVSSQALRLAEKIQSFGVARWKNYTARLTVEAS